MFVALTRSASWKEFLITDPFENGGQCLTAAFSRNINDKTKKAAFDALHAQEPDTKNGNYNLPMLKFADRVSLFFLGLSLMIPVINIIINIAWRRFFKDDVTIATKKNENIEYVKTDGFYLRNLLHSVQDTLTSDLEKIYTISGLSGARNVHLFYQTNPSNGPIDLVLCYENFKGTIVKRISLKYGRFPLEQEKGTFVAEEIVRQFRFAIFRDLHDCRAIDQLLSTVGAFPPDKEFPAKVKQLNQFVKGFFSNEAYFTIVNYTDTGVVDVDNRGIGPKNAHQADLLEAAFNRCVDVYLRDKFKIPCKVI